MLLCYDDEQAWEKAGKQALDSAMQEAVKLAHRLDTAGNYVSASPLHPSSIATSVSCSKRWQNRDRRPVRRDARSVGWVLHHSRKGPIGSNGNCKPALWSTVRGSRSATSFRCFEYVMDRKRIPFGLGDGSPVVPTDRSTDELFAIDLSIAILPKRQSACSILAVIPPDERVLNEQPFHNPLFVFLQVAARKPSTFIESP